MSSDTAARPSRARRTPFGRPRKDDGPRATFRQLLPYLAEHRAALILTAVLSVLGAVASLAVPLITRELITVVQRGGALGGLVGLVILLVVASALISGVQHYLLQRTGTSVVLSARTRLVRRMLGLPISEFDTRRVGDLVSRVGSDTTLLYAVLTQGLVDAIGGALIFIGSLIAMFLLDPVLLGLTATVIALSVVVVVVLSGRIRVASRRQQEKVGDLAAAVERAVSAVRTVRAAGATEREVAAIEQDARGAWTQGIRVAKVSALVVPIAGIALQASFLVVLGVGGARVAAGQTTIANLASFIIFLFLLVMPLGNAFGAVTSVNSALGALGRIEEIIGLPSEVELDAGIVPAPAIETTDALRFDDVVFRYPEKAHRTETEKAIADIAPDALPEHDRTVLHGVSFAVPRGRRTALVGPSGAGKSTILALIERFYDPTEGVVRLGGEDVRALDRGALRAQIGYVEQDAPVLAGTLRQNLTLATPDASDEQCVEVLRSVNLTEVLERNELGLDAPVGEDGVMLSGGERQRLAIARALLAAPPILLLDESTSSLDGLNEQLLREAIDAVAENRTLIVIAHRLSTVVDSDQIIVLDHGRVVGVGTHSELVGTVPLYRDLAKHQLLV
ncbi:ABC transporter ATP-binding protein [Galbitalea soli]|uniref:ABC transporter ATP-binding protein n=1 Tax=Galbitalea soli TaxID=1268042 RepID=A0A7C9TQF9_9MICO|nr:ABC transporter ATP-binding protein [Galbitalea soli]NEM91278.1 ABC transporter ATP-binding protein [Galbitalea soli]NYJ29967.1 ATP-binding cassette subfamily B protein [Galbitalea soli]